MKRIAMHALKRFGVRLLVARGVPEPWAEMVADAAVLTEAFGVRTHGVVMFNSLDRAIGKTVDPLAAPRIVRERAASAAVDGARGIGTVAVRFAADLAVRKAREAGVATVSVGKTSWIGALGAHLIPLAQQGFLAQMWAQTNTCRDCAPVGGLEATFSTNPVAFAMPTSGDPIVGDISTATVSMGQVGRMVREGRRAPEPIFMDRDGRLTDDPSVVRQDGSILFLGGRHFGHKGYVLSLWCEALAAASGGGCNDPEAETHQSFTLTVADPDAFVGREAYLAEMDRFIRRVKSSRPAPGVGPIRLPGERGFAALREAEREGVPLEDHTLEGLRALDAKYGLGFGF